jgi:hypothetical protein
MGSSSGTCKPTSRKSYTGTLGIFKKHKQIGEQESAMSCKTNDHCDKFKLCFFHVANADDCNKCSKEECGTLEEKDTALAKNKKDAAKNTKSAAKNIDAQDLSKEDTAKVQEMEAESMSAGYITSLRQNTMTQYKERYAAPDPIAEYTAFDWCGEGANDHKRVLSTDPMLILSPTLNTFQVTSSGEDGSYHVGTVADGCARPVSVGGVCCFQ